MQKYLQHNFASAHHHSLALRCSVQMSADAFFKASITNVIYFYIYNFFLSLLQTRPRTRKYRAPGYAHRATAASAHQRGEHSYARDFNLSLHSTLQQEGGKWRIERESEKRECLNGIRHCARCSTFTVSVSVCARHARAYNINKSFRVRLYVVSGLGEY